MDHGFSDDELLEINYKTCLKIIKDILSSKNSDHENLGKIKLIQYYADCAVKMKPEEVYENCKQFIEKEIK